jgi:hypothetical protein
MAVIQIAGAVAILAGVVAYAFWVHRPSRQYVLSRAADEGRWTHLYSGEELVVAKEALAAITYAFLLRTQDAARLRPEDRLMDIYRAAYPVRNTPDALEFETLWKQMKAELSVTEAEFGTLTDLTVQDVIRMWLDKRGGRRTRG